MSLLDEIITPGMDDYSYFMSAERRPTGLWEAWRAHAARDAWDTMIMYPIKKIVENTNEADFGASYAAERAGMSDFERDEFVSANTYRFKDLTEDEYRASKWFREDIPYEEGVAEPGWMMRADVYDSKRFRDWQIANRRASFMGEGLFMFTGSLAGGAYDPLNYIPFGGAAFRGALMARGLSRGFAHVIAQGAESAALTAAAEPFLLSQRRAEGEDVTFADGIIDVSMAALLGSTFAAASPLAKIVYKQSVGRLAERYSPEARAGREAAQWNMRPANSAFIESRSLIVMDKAVGDHVTGNRIDVGPEAVAVAREMRRLMPGPESFELEMRARLRELGANVDVILPRSAFPSEPARGARGAAVEAAGAPTPPPTPEAAGGRSTPASREGAPAPQTPVAERVESTVEKISPASRAKFEATMKRRLERNAAETLTATEQKGEALRAQLRELNRLPDSIEKQEAVKAIKEQIESNDGTIKAARLALREGVVMPDAQTLDVLHARELSSVAGGAAPMVQTDRMDTTVGKPVDGETPPVELARVEQNPAMPSDEAAGVNPDTGEFDEMDWWNGALKLDRVTAEDKLAYSIADAEFKRAKNFPELWSIGAQCLTG